MRKTFEVRTLTVNGVANVLFLDGGNGADYLEYDPDTIFIQAGKVYVKITAFGGAVGTLLAPTPAPVEGAILDQLGHLVYHASAWYLQVG